MGEDRTITTPLPGIFYRRPSPEADPYISEGDEVNAGNTIGLVEIMKTFYEIKAEQSGVIDRFLVENEEAVEAGQDIVALD